VQRERRALHKAREALSDWLEWIVDDMLAERWRGYRRARCACFWWMRVREPPGSTMADFRLHVSVECRPGVSRRPS